MKPKFILIIFMIVSFLIAITISSCELKRESDIIVPSSTVFKSKVTLEEISSDDYDNLLDPSSIDTSEEDLSDIEDIFEELDEIFDEVDEEFEFEVEEA